ncbi:hypothetical protein B296_00006356 [Ensete ventricosum]|uniref:Uncharacterized protein n=1 Tax=Ensete ventricosum TaxID=4639 RepID=A0A427AJN3_ENSVE|nr:hypothetical protein B296_00006356 [Ensete ventricosum]
MTPNASRLWSIVKIEPSEVHCSGERPAETREGWADVTVFTLVCVPLKVWLAYSLGGPTASSGSRNDTVHISFPSSVAKDHFSFSSFSKPLDLTSLSRFVSFRSPVDQVGMVSTNSFSVSSFSSPLSSHVPPPREERCRSNDSLGNQSGPESSSSSVMTEADAKALQALEALKSHHDFDSTVCLESLGSVRKRFSIPSEYVLQASRSGQRPYHPCPGGQGDYYLTARSGFRVGGSPSNNKGWKARFLFVSRHRGWDFGIEWSAHPISNVPPKLSDEETNVVEQLKGILSASRTIRNLTEEWLVEAGLSPSSRGMPYSFHELDARKSPGRGGILELHPRFQLRHRRLRRSRPSSPGQPLTCRRSPSRRSGVRQRLQK